MSAEPKRRILDIVMLQLLLLAIALFLFRILLRRFPTLRLQSPSLWLHFGSVEFGRSLVVCVRHLTNSLLSLLLLFPSHDKLQLASRKSLSLHFNRSIIFRAKGKKEHCILFSLSSSLKSGNRYRLGRRRRRRRRRAFHS